MSRNKIDIKCLTAQVNVAKGFVKRVNKETGLKLIAGGNWEKIGDQSQSVFDKQRGIC